MLVSAIMGNKGAEGVVTVTPGTTLEQAAQLLAEKRIGTVVISGTGRTAHGILSERDIVREIALQGAGCLSQPVEDHMTRKVETCTATDSADSVLARMTQGRFRHMPVVDGERLTGLVTLGDVVKAQLAEVAMEKDALQSMVMGH